MRRPQEDCAAFYALFAQSDTLTLTDQMSISVEARNVLDVVCDECLARNRATLPDGSSIVLLNRSQALAPDARFVRLVAPDGDLMLPAYQLKRIVV